MFVFVRNPISAGGTVFQPARHCVSGGFINFQVCEYDFCTISPLLETCSITFIGLDLLYPSLMTHSVTFSSVSVLPGLSFVLLPLPQIFDDPSLERLFSSTMVSAGAPFCSGFYGSTECQCTLSPSLGTVVVRRTRLLRRRLRKLIVQL